MKVPALYNRFAEDAKVREALGACDFELLVPPEALDSEMFGGVRPIPSCSI
jgi:hypothetical protein